MEMSSRTKDLTGMRFGRLEVLEYAGRDKYGPQWMCKCDCGNKKIIPSSFLRNGVRSCGCKQINKSDNAHRHPTHGGSYTRLYRTYWSIKTRCNNPRSTSYHNYGGRGIKLEWKDFREFQEWSCANGYKEEEQDQLKFKLRQALGRIDMDGNYGPNNCYWSTVQNLAQIGSARSHAKKAIAQTSNNRRTRMKIICSVSEAADIIRNCKDANCSNCIISNVCNDGTGNKHPERFMEIVNDVDSEDGQVPEA